MTPRPPSALRYRGPEADLDLLPPTPRDAGPLVAALEASLPELRAFMPWAHLPQTVDGQYERLVGIQAAYWRAGDMVFHLWEPGGAFLGCAGLHPRALNPRAREIGYWVRSDRAGRGLATLATQCLLVAAFEHLGCDRVQCGFNAENAASARVNAKVGFRREAALRRFEGQPSDALRAGGYRGGPDTVMTALFPEDRDTLPWYAAVRAHLEIVPWDG